MRIRKTKEERKEEIRAAACSVFLERGITESSMDEIIRRTTLSKGGVYHHYANIYEILFDIFMTCNNERIDIMSSWMTEHHLTLQQMNNPKLLAKAITDKILTNTEYSKLYALFLIAARTDPRLRDLYETVVDSCRIDLGNFFAVPQGSAVKDDNCYRGMTELINMFMVSTQLLGSHEYFSKHRDDVEALIFTYLTRNIPGATDAA